MPELFHIADRSAWLAAQQAGEYRVSTRGLTLAEQGFIHCALRDQLRGVADRIYADADDLVVLVIDEARLGDVPVRYEGTGPEKFPHLYGPLPASAVTSVVPVGRDGAGRFILPD